ncbi:MAG: ATP-binding cassette domain-containing protein, partial [Clostridiales bacterium]|nr:ATP-binding cassette domain-containing protein [Clostridiales bacterium]
MSRKEIIRFRSVTREYGAEPNVLKAVDDASFSIMEGEFAIILGPSGAGKSTLLNLLGGMDRATAGSITVNGRDITGLTDDGLTEYRAENVGFVFQFYNLIPTLTALENVALTRKIVKNPIDAREALGFKKGAITRHYIAYGFFLVLAGAALGCLLGPITLPVLSLYVRVL